MEQPIDHIGVSSALRTWVLPSPETMGAAAGRELRARVDQLPAGAAIMLVLAAAPSQDTFLNALATQSDFPWDRTHIHHLDEYIGLPAEHPNSFRTYLEEHIVSRVPINADRVHYITDLSGSAEDVRRAYGAAYATGIGGTRSNGGTVIACIGIGENGHIAFNEPGSSLDTSEACRIISLDDRSVLQQYNDYRDHPNPAARYATVADVPQMAWTLSISAILAADTILCLVPGAQKADAVRDALEGPLSPSCPASYLRLHRDVNLFLDCDSAQLLHDAPALGLEPKRPN